PLVLLVFFPLLIVRDSSRAFKLKAESHFLQPLLAHCVAQTRFIFGVEHQESSASSADELAAEGAVRQSATIPLIDALVTHSSASALLVFPVNIHQSAEFRNVPAFESAFGAKGELFDEMKIARHLGVLLLALVVLLFQDRRCR